MFVYRRSYYEGLQCELGEFLQRVLITPRDFVERSLTNQGKFPEVLIQVYIGGHPPFPTGSKQFYGNFGNLLLLVVFNFWGPF
jgi:hypothetical protein